MEVSGTQTSSKLEKGCTLRILKKSLVARLASLEQSAGSKEKKPLSIRLGFKSKDTSTFATIQPSREGNHSSFDSGETRRVAENTNVTTRKTQNNN